MSTSVYRSAFPSQDFPKITYNGPFPTLCVQHLNDACSRASRIYIIASGSLSRHTDALSRLQHAIIGTEKQVVGVRRGMTPHTLWSEVLEIVGEARAAKADCVVTLGAGSLTDGAKIVVLALANDISTRDDLETLCSDSANQRSHIHPATIPIICIPTSLSGGEYSALAGGTDDTTQHKHAFQHPSIGPRLIILDPELCTTTPARVWLSTGIRSVDHCVETLASSRSGAETDRDAEGGLRLLVPSLLRCKEFPQDLDARLRCQLGVVEAMKAVSQGVPMGGSHALGHQLGPLGVGHGETSCVLLPAVMKYNMRANAAKQQKIVEILWSEETAAGAFHARGLDRTTADLGDALDAVIRALGLPRSLSAVGVHPDKLEELAEGSLKDAWCRTNPVPLTEKAQVLEILDMAMNDT